MKKINLKELKNIINYFNDQKLKYINKILMKNE